MGRTCAVLLVLAATLLTAKAASDTCSSSELAFNPETFLPKNSKGSRGIPDQSTLDQCKALQAVCKPGSCQMQHQLLGNIDTGIWGFYYEGLQPALIVQSGDTIDWELPTMTAHYAYEEMVEGDPGIETLYVPVNGKPAVTTQGASGAQDGGHWQSGPIWICGAEPGDVLQVDILSLEPKSHPVTGKSYGATVSGSIGWHYIAGMLAERGPHAATTIYEYTKDETGKAIYAEPIYSYIPEDVGIVSECLATSGEYPRTTEAGAAEWRNPNLTYHGTHVPCINGKQTWPNGMFPPSNFKIPEKSKDYSIAGKFRKEVGPHTYHIGNIGTTPATGVPVNSNAPFRTGGNFDARRLNMGTTLYLPIEVAGALLMAGDGHGAEGDGETSGCGIETSLDAKVRLTVHKAGSLPPPLQDLNYPLIETPEEWIIHGLQWPDYLRELENPQDAIFEQPDLTRAMTNVYNQTRDFMMRVYGLKENEVLTAMGIGIDMGITQIVDGNVGLHALVPKAFLEFERGPATSVA